MRALPTLGNSVTSYSAYHHVGMQPGTHLGLPSPSVTVVLSIGAPTHIVATPVADQAPAVLMALVGGFYMGPVVIGYDNEMCGIQLDLNSAGGPAGFRNAGIRAGAPHCGHGRPARPGERGTG